MSLKQPESMEECVYFTNRAIEEDGKEGHVIAWVYRKECPECKKAKMGKTVVKGKVKSRADYYECPDCKYQEPKSEHEESLTIEAQYTCQECGKEGEGTGPYVRKTYKAVKCYLVDCEHCQAKVPITKKLKAIKKKVKKKVVKK